MAFLLWDDLTPFAADIEARKASEMIADATALATLAAPCLSDELALTDAQVSAVRAVLRTAVLRWNEAGSGAVQSEAVGGWSATLDNRQPRRGMFWPSEIVQLQNICGGTGSRAYGIDTTPAGWGVRHLDTCSVNFGGDCSCGAILLSGTLP
jgi:hypothetical protein